MNSAQAGKILERGLGRGKNFARLLSRKAGLGVGKRFRNPALYAFSKTT